MSFQLRGGEARRQSHASSRSARERWQSRYVHRLWVTDLAVVCAAVATGQLLRFDGLSDPLVAWDVSAEVRYTAISAAVALLWMAFLGALSTRSPRVIGSGFDEYRRLVTATMQLFGLLAIASLVLHLDIARGYLAITLPLGLLGLMLNRLLWRGYIARRRARNDYLTSVLVVGSRYAARAIATAFYREATSGYRVVGICTPDGDENEEEPQITVAGRAVPIVGDDRSVLEAVSRTGADTVAVTATDHLGPGILRSLAWELEALGVDLIVAPGVVDIAAPRLTSRPVADMPMLHIEKPQYDRAKSIGKSVFDFCFAFTALVVFAPVMVIAAIMIKLTSQGPVFYRSERIGMDGKPFGMIKFRSMYTDADKHIDALIEMNGGDPLFFKMKNDPRVTPIGRVLRKYSLDELPQFFNVLRGEMSVVGPRPQVQREVDSYNGVVRRRLLVKPGVTGAWQVGGRSDLSLDDSVRLDLCYVENWSMVLDLLIIAKTVAAVARSEGAY